MPVQYAGVIEEHHAVRKQAGLFDGCHMGEFLFQGAGAPSYLQHITANDISRLVDGQAQYSLLCNENGGIVDDIIVYRRGPEDFLMVVNAANIDKDWAWVQNHKIEKVTLKNISDETALIALQGPAAVSILEKIAKAPVATLSSFHFAKTDIGPVPNCTAARTGYTGEDGFEIFCATAQAPALWQALLEAGKSEGIKPAGLGARDTLRLEACLSLYGHELTDETNPMEAGVGWVVKWDKTDFIGKKALTMIREKGLTRKRVGFTMTDKGIAREGSSVFLQDRPVGMVTSGSYSPTLEKPIGLAYVPLQITNIGDTFHVDIRKNLRLAEVVKTPFYKRR